MANNDQSPTRKRSHSPSAISTASSGSPLIHSDLSDDAIEGADIPRLPYSAGMQQSGPFKRPAPTSIAAAQLRQQGLHPDHSEKQKSTRSNKHQNGNKLAHMAEIPAMNQSHLEQVDYRLKTTVSSVNDRQSVSPQHREKPKMKKLKEAGEKDKSFGYNLGKTLAYRANSFNEFWSVNKLRYMNLACLLMTLVCLFTILLFSKTTMTTNGSSNPIGAPKSSIQQQQQPTNPTGSLSERLKNLHRILEGNEEDRREDDSEQETPVESIDSIDRLPFERTPSQRHSVRNGDDREAADIHGDFSMAGSRVVNSDGFNLFDERHDDSTEPPSSKRSLEDMLQDARHQLRRQQRTEQEMEELTSPSKSSQQDSTESAAAAVGNQNKRIFQDPISQVLQDLDGFGLFKSIRSRLIDHMHQQNLTSKPPTIVRSKNGATIIMSFSNDAAQNNSSPSQNDTSRGAVPSFLRDLLPPMMVGDASSSFDKRPSGFAAITINSEPILSIRSGLPLAGGAFESSLGGPFTGPVPFGLGLPPFMSATPNQRPPVMAGAGDGFLSLIMRASNELANQMRQQLEQVYNQTGQVGANGTTANINNTSGGKQEPQASQQVKVIQLLGSGLIEGRPELARNDSSRQAMPATENSTSTSNSKEVETFGLSRLIGSPTTRQATFRLPLSPFHSIYSAARRSAAPIGGGSMVMIESSSGIPSSILSGESSLSFADGSGPFGQGSPSLLNEIGSSGGPSSLMPPFPFLPNVFLLGGRQRALGSRFPEPANPMLRSILNNVVSDMSQSVLKEGATRKTGKLGKKFASSKGDGQEDNDWDELGPQESASKSRSRQRVVDSSDPTEDSNDESTPESQETPFRLPAPNGGSLFEQMFEQLNNVQRPQTFGTIRHTIRGPDGVTVERVIGLPPSSLSGDGGSRTPHEHVGRVQTVPAGVRSQSLSRMDTPMNNKLRPNSPFAHLFGGDIEQDSSSGAPSSPKSFISQLLGHELASERHDDSNHDSVQPRSFRAHIGALRPGRNSIMSERSDSTDSDSDDEPPFWPNLPRVRVASARIRLLSPRSDSSHKPAHFRLPASNADQQDQTAELPTPPNNHGRRLTVASPFTSPRSPLFGFPALKGTQAGLSPPSGSEQQESFCCGGISAPAESLERGEPASGQSASHRRQRSFVYHSNHEIAQNHARRAAVPNQQQQQQTGPLPPAASVVTGRRLDDFVERR